VSRQEHRSSHLNITPRLDGPLRDALDDHTVLVSTERRCASG